MAGAEEAVRGIAVLTEDDHHNTSKCMHKDTKVLTDKQTMNDIVRIEMITSFST